MYRYIVIFLFNYDSDTNTCTLRLYYTLEKTWLFCVLAQDVYTGDSRILWSTFPVKTCFMAIDGDKPHWIPTDANVGNLFKCGFGCICRYFQIQTKYQIQTHSWFPIQIKIHKTSVLKYAFGPNPAGNLLGSMDKFTSDVRHMQFLLHFTKHLLLCLQPLCLLTKVFFTTHPFYFSAGSDWLPSARHRGAEHHVAPLSGRPVLSSPSREFIN